MFCIVDLETTGGSAAYDRITEVAIYKHDGTEIVDEYVTLVNPERSIPLFITGLTGIDDEMVAAAPSFFEIAKDIIEFTENTTLVAHNARFDYSFLRQAFKDLGYDYKRKTICSCKLSRKLLPGYRSYGLGNLCKELNIPNSARHRAAGDALATVTLFELLLLKDNKGLIDFSITEWKNELKFPDTIKPDEVFNLPEEPGVYYFLNNQQEIIYVGKSKNLKKRVSSYFNLKKHPRAKKLHNDIAHFSYELTGNETVALLLETNEIKKHQPRYNRARKRDNSGYGIYDSVNQNGFIELHIEKEHDDALPVASFITKGKAEASLNKMIDKHHLCLKLCELEAKTKGPCFHFHLKKCNGACVNKETASEYNQRIDEVIKQFTFEQPSFILLDKGRNADETSVVCVENGQYRGFGYIEGSGEGYSTSDLMECITESDNNRDIQSILRAQIYKNQYKKLISL
ncbi:MAG: GIY-YIG nuclease family protein [Bacteroidia bacterium]|nr:GIY-YIG nuclease family protein [Bacteroidia bacterium]